ncbi:hypothetical protein PHYSODRAFT_496952, partial [Phytophthora sojae]
CASRVSPPFTTDLRRRFSSAFLDQTDDYAREWKRIWWVMSTVCMTVLWTQRKQVVHNGGQVTIASSVAAFQQAGLRQLRALARRERGNPRTIVQGTRLLICLDLFQRAPREAPRPEASHVQPPGSSR